MLTKTEVFALHGVMCNKVGGQRLNDRQPDVSCFHAGLWFAFLKYSHGKFETTL